MYKPIFKTF